MNKVLSLICYYILTKSNDKEEYKKIVLEAKNKKLNIKELESKAIKRVTKLISDTKRLGFDTDFNAYNIGYNLHYDYWGKGYGKEAAKALLDWGIKQGYKEFVARHFEGNIKSQKIILSLGFKFDKFMDFNKIGEDKPIKCLIYRLHI